MNNHPNYNADLRDKIPDSQTKGLTGKVRRILHDKGYGFIQGDNGYDYFWHWSALTRQAKFFRHVDEGDSAIFDIEMDERGRGWRVKPNTMYIAKNSAPLPNSINTTLLNNQANGVQ